MPFSRLLQRARTAAWKESEEARAHAMNAAWVSFVQHRCAPLTEHEDWPAWLRKLGLLPEPPAPTKSEKQRIMEKIQRMNQQLN